MVPETQRDKNWDHEEVKEHSSSKVLVHTFHTAHGAMFLWALMSWKVYPRPLEPWTLSQTSTHDQEVEQQFTGFIVVPLSSHEIDGVRKEQERLTAARNFHLDAAVLPFRRAVTKDMNSPSKVSESSVQTLQTLHKRKVHERLERFVQEMV